MVTPTPEPQVGALTQLSDLSFYVCTGAPPGYQDGYCGNMASGRQVYEGAAACGYAWALGTRLRFQDGTVVTCEDRGLGSWHWVDVFFWDYAAGRAWRDRQSWPWYVEVVE